MLKYLSLLSVFLLAIGILSACSSPRAEKITESPLEVKVSSLSDGNYTIDALNSRLSWRGSMLAGTKSHSGTAPLLSGNLSVLNGVPANGIFVIDLSSLKSDEGITDLENHLKGADFFDTEKYPQASFLVREGRDLGNGKYSLSGDMTIKDISRPLEIIASLSASGDSIRAESETVIDRTEWGVKYGSGKFFQDLGDKALSDKIDLTLDLSLIK